MTTYSMSWRQLGIAAFAAIGMTFCLPASAQSDDEGEDADDAPLVEEIIVTATYRDTQLMDTPLTITALTDIEIEARGVEDITDLFLSVPGLNYGQAAPTWHYVNARGIAQFRSPTGPVSMYIDNTPVQGLGARSPQLPNFDLERIEVLKGPQGTLYGQGSMAAAIRYITKKPNVEGFDWALSTRIENPSHSDDTGHRIDAMVNIPLGDRIAARVTPYSRNKPGILDKYGPRIIPDVDFRDEIGFRAQLAWYANDRVTVNFTHHYVDSMHGAPGTAHHCYVDGRPAEGNLAPGDFVAQIPRFPVTAGLAGGADWLDPETNCERGQNGAFGRRDRKIQGGPRALLRDAHGLAAMERRRVVEDVDQQPQHRMGTRFRGPDVVLGNLRAPHRPLGGAEGRRPIRHPYPRQASGGQISCMAFSARESQADTDR